MARDIVVVGAGMVGVSVAWHLAQRGHAVTLVDRRAPGREMSVSKCHTGPCRLRASRAPTVRSACIASGHAIPGASILRIASAVI